MKVYSTTLAWLRKFFRFDYYLGFSRKPRPLPIECCKDPAKELDAFMRSLDGKPLRNKDNV